MTILNKIQEIINEKWVASQEFSVIGKEGYKKPFTAEIFAEPTPRDIKDILEQQEDNNGVRLGLSDDDTLYAWDGSVWHDQMIRWAGKNLIRMSVDKNTAYISRTEHKQLVDDGRWEMLFDKVLSAFPNLQFIVNQGNEEIWSKFD